MSGSGGSPEGVRHAGMKGTRAMMGPGSQARPLGVTILAILAAIGGVFGALGGIGIVFLGGVAATVTGGLGAIVAILGLVLLALSVVELVLAYGFWMLRQWAWKLGFILEAAAVLLGIVQVLAGGSSISSLLVTVVVAGIILYYLNTPDVRKAFATPETGFPVVGNSLDQYLPGGKDTKA